MKTRQRPLNNLEEIYKKVAEETGYPYKVVELVYKLYWDGIKDHFRNLNLTDKEMSKEDFYKQGIRFNLRWIGNISIDYYRWKKKLRKKGHIMDSLRKKKYIDDKQLYAIFKKYEHKENQTDVYKDCDNDE